VEASSSKVADPLASLPETPKLIALSGLALVIAVAFFNHGTLVDAVPLPVTVICVIIFSAFGIWLSRQYDPPAYMDVPRRIMAHASFPVVSAIMGFFLTHAAVEAVAFAAVNAPSKLVEARVIRKYQWTRIHQRIATVSIDDRAPAFDVRISTELARQLVPGRDCLALAIQTGHWGLRRAILPRSAWEPSLGRSAQKVWRRPLRAALSSDVRGRGRRPACRFSSAIRVPTVPTAGVSVGFGWKRISAKWREARWRC
jgi:hypothetical protein